MTISLLIDRNYTALSIISWKRAAKLLVGGKAEPVESQIVKKVKTVNGIFDIPSIIRLLVCIPWRAHRDRLKFSRRNVMIRDEHKCQYCGIKLGKNTGTIDHIIPRSQGGETNYRNCVACCKKCNNKKGDLTPDKAGMTLLKPPKRPTFISLYKNRVYNNCPEEWAGYIIGVS